MHRIDSSTATPDNRFTEGDPTIPVAATTVTAAWLNAIQEEVVAVLDAAEIAPDKADNAQVLAAITKLIADKIPDVATLTTRGMGRIATLADALVDAVIKDGPAFIDAGTFKFSTTPAAGASPRAGVDARIAPAWVGMMLCNVRTVITVSGTFVAPVSGWYRIRCVGAGGAGGGAPIHGGYAGGTTSFGAYLSALGGAGGAGAGRLADYQTGGGSGGGAAGEVSEALIYLAKDTSVTVTIGAGGTCSTTYNTLPTGTGAPAPSYSSATSFSRGTSGAKGAGNGTASGYDATVGNHMNGTGGNGGRNGTGYGGGGGGSGSANGIGGLGADGGANGSIGTSTSTVSVQGGRGGDGAIIIEYFNPAIAA